MMENICTENINQTLEERKQEALQTAAKCRQILLEKGAKEVILFGSLSGESPWHWQSDLDLAVRGMSEKQQWEAYSLLEKITPNWLKIDLVALEEIPDFVRSRILKEKPMPNNKYLALKTRIEDEMIALEQNFQAMKTALEQSDNVPEIFITPTLSSYICDFYTACERISERVAVTLDGGIPKAENWHEQLLLQMAEIGGENRPPLWQGSLLLQLNDYLKFRHLARHNYNLQLRKERVLELAKQTEIIIAKIQEAIALFSQWLESQVKDL
ncbi:nucleotidyltransferase domain-containing protein [Dolichospermum circinale CS-534/05]|uniref:nucleotidyltransferase family protein n=1 Tax=Dolichospermum circinale TaxID=109265 RepID=UPI00232FF029|nr:nucleotidyltransferase domain-containing protein [Dolichospermum circinale]MDB9456410.1 nucleotidyltransferase domain-containing protein [Dolichospermum circinale CS-541/06]MDB9463230.1 nucleotidyltransferase domain-containing protein [Dolichospermum circinale CS-541/04]MDB9489007.1 nucleotidyltransferase domain-containing protein [Dolichospermum circinale CS-534/05]MDB9549182.1 nucleotidyltransferase domain-containing protein [Dolichospermum circinale CS-1031]